MKALIAALMLACGLCAAQPVAAQMDAAGRAKLDLSADHVTAPGAGYFDMSGRKAFLATTRDPVLRAEMARLRTPVSCKDAMALPVFRGDTATPDYYVNPNGWKEHSVKFHSYEDVVSLLAGAEFATESGAHGRCLINLLDRWATGGAFMAFDRKKAGLQTWFQIESALFASAFAYSIVRAEVPGMEVEKQRIEKWLVDASRLHIAYEGGKEGTCCNNHFYRRAVHAAIIGSITGQDDLFRFGVSAIYSAIANSNPDGSLPLEMVRKRYAAHYQNYATMYLVFIAQIARMQGYDLYSITDGERSLDRIISYTLAVNDNPAQVVEHSGTTDLVSTYLKDDQFLGWLELVAQRPQHRDAALRQLSCERPTYNRSLGGFVSLYFMDPALKPSTPAS